MEDTREAPDPPGMAAGTAVGARTLPPNREGGVATYEGQLRDGQAHGEGSAAFLHPSGSAFEGERYEGAWQANMKHGWGAVTYADGDHYEGEWMSDMKHGKGKCTWGGDGSVRDGQWKENEFVGGPEPEPEPEPAPSANDLLRQLHAARRSRHGAAAPVAAAVSAVAQGAAAAGTAGGVPGADGDSLRSWSAAEVAGCSHGHSTCLACCDTSPVAVSWAVLAQLEQAFGSTGAMPKPSESEATAGVPLRSLVAGEITWPGIFGML